MRELSGLSDVILLGMVAENDEAALREIVERHSPWLLLRLLRKTPDRDLAHEALHDTFVAVWKHPRSFRGDGDLGAWRGASARPVGLDIDGGDRMAVGVFAGIRTCARHAVGGPVLARTTSSVPI